MMNKTFHKAVFALALAATTCISFAQAPAAADAATPPPKMEKPAHAPMMRHAKAPFAPETMAAIQAYRRDASEANLEALKAKLASDFDARLAKQQEMLDKMKVKREQHLEMMVKFITSPKFTAPDANGEKPRQKMKGRKAPCPKCAQKMYEHGLGPRPDMHRAHGPRPEGAPKAGKGHKHAKKFDKKHRKCPHAKKPDAPAEAPVAAPTPAE